MLLETRQQLDKFNLTFIDLDGVKVVVSNKVICLGVTVDRELTFAADITCLAGRCFYQLRQLRTIRRSLSVEVARTLVHAFVISRMKYCNSVFGSMCANHHLSLQSVRNAAVPDCKEAKVRPHHGLSSRQTELAACHYRLIYKLCLFVYKSVHNVTPSYLVDQCVPASINIVRRGLRSETNYDLMYPRTRYIRYGDRSFGVIDTST